MLVLKQTCEDVHPSYSFTITFSATRLNSCGTNIYESRKKRDLLSLLRAWIQETKEMTEKKELEEELKTENLKEEEKVVERVLGGTPSKKGEYPVKV